MAEMDFPTYQLTILAKLDKHGDEISGIRGDISKSQAEILKAVNTNERRIALLEKDTQRHDKILEYFWQKILGVALTAAASAVGVGLALLRHSQ
jgi:hypothetical protein